MEGQVHRVIGRHEKLSVLTEQSNVLRLVVRITDDGNILIQKRVNILFQSIVDRRRVIVIDVEILIRHAVVADVIIRFAIQIVILMHEPAARKFGHTGVEAPFIAPHFIRDVHFFRQAVFFKFLLVIRGDG